jgi:4-carboxymuconolactone decarboxylase
VKSFSKMSPGLVPGDRSFNPIPRRNPLRKLTKNTFFAASLLLWGGISTMASAQSRDPAASDAVPVAQQSRAQQLMGATAPKLAELTDNVLYGDIWERPGLSKRDRSMITVAALIALNRSDQLRSHLTLAQQNGATEEELVEAITHLAFYAGWPSAASAVAVARVVFKKN